MSARPDIRQLAGGNAGHPNQANPAHNQYFSRHPLNARHTPTNYLVDPAAAGKSMRTTPQPPQVAGVPVSLSGGLTIGRSSSPAARGPPNAYSANILNPVRHHLPIHAGASSASPFAGIRDPAAYLRGSADRHVERVPHSSSASGASRLTLSRQPNYNDPYTREVAAQIHPGLHNLHPSSAQAAIAAANAAALIASSSANPEMAHKRPRLDLGHPAVSVAGSSGSATIAQPLRIDTREAVKESCYQPPVEAISPTGPEVSGEQMDDLKSMREELLKKISKVDREIAKTECQIVKLRKKHQEQEEHANKPLSDTNEEEEKPKNLSIAQVIYSENRKKAKLAHENLDKKHDVKELPLYNQPSDTSLYHENKRNHAIFKKTLVDLFRRKADEKEARERYLTDTYAKLSISWSKKVERVENSRKRKERDAKARELYEKIFPELRKQREDKERDHRLGTRGAVRSEADIEDVIERLQEQEMEDKKMHSLAVIPPLLLAPEERKRKYTNNNGLILDPLREYSERKFVNTWTEQEKEIFKEKFLLHPKNFGLIAQSLERKTVSDCVQYYYLSKKTENYKQLLRKSKMGRGRRRNPNPTAAAQAAAAAAQAANEQIIGATSSGVLTRNRNKNENENSRDGFDGSNRSTPNPIKQEPKEEKEEDDKKGGKGSKDQRNDSSDDEDSPQSVKSSPHLCSVCKGMVENSRQVTTKALAALLGLPDFDSGNENRVCNPCFMKVQRKKGNNNCPVPTCTSTKGRVKGRLRHMPNKLKDLPKDAREAINNEFHISDHTKKCCSACFTRLTRRIAQLTDGTSTVIKQEAEPTNSITWTDEEIETFKVGLKNSGRNWAVISQKMNGAKTTEQCKKFFYNNRKKYQLDKLVTEFKRSTQSGDQPPTLSSDEESGSSTSSCEEGPAGNSATPSGNSSPVPKKAEKTSSNNVDMKPPVKVEDVKHEFKTESEPIPIPISASSSASAPLQQPKKEEEYDSSATMSADERESDTNQSRAPYMQQPYLPPGVLKETSISARAPFPGPAPPPGAQIIRSAHIRAPVCGAPPGQMVRPLGAPPPQANFPPTSAAVPNSKDTITVKELMINVIEKTLSTPYQAHQVQVGIPPTTTHGAGPGHPSQQPPPSPTIQNLLDSSSKPPNKTNFVKERVGLNPLTRVGTMAPPAAPPPAAVTAPSVPPSSQQSDCETLDLSMPRRRESANATPPSYQQRDPILHRRSPSYAASASGADARPPPAHSNKVKTDPHLREISPSSYEGRSLPTPPHLLGMSASPGPARPPSSSSRVQPPQSYLGRSQVSSAPGRQPALSPKMTSNKPPLTIQTGSITQGTPAIQQRYGEPLLKMTPPDTARSAQGGSITQGTPCFDKNIRREPSYYPPGRGPTTSLPEQHLSSRQVIMNDYAMARSTEMQRRPDSRDAHGRSISPASNNRGNLRDLSPRPRTIDPRSQVLTRDGRPVSTDPRLDPRYIAAVQAEHANRANLSGLPEPRGDPKADNPLHKDHRSLQRGQPSRGNFFVSAGQPLQPQQVYLAADGRYTAASRSRSPPRSTPPPARPNMSMPRQGGITSGKPIVTKELYRGAPEVTISKTSSPRGIAYNEVTNNALASLVDVAVQQPKLDLNQIRNHQAALLAMAGNPKAASSLSAASTSTSQLVQQVQAERTKQQYYLANEHAAAVAAVANFSSAARITTSKPPSASTSSLSRPDAPAVIISERERQQQQIALAKLQLSGMNNAQNVIDAIITQSIQGGHPDLVKAMAAQAAQAAQQEKLEAAAAQAIIANNSRPPSGHEKPSLPADMMFNKELSITPAPPANSEKRPPPVMISTSATLTPTTSAGAPTRVADERQIIRVAQQQQQPQASPTKQPAIEDPKKDKLPQMPVEDNNGDQAGLSPLDYVKNKIVEEMKKQPEELAAAQAAAAQVAAAAGQKRPSPQESPNNEKKAKLSEEAVDSPGSPGDMVIDESADRSTTPTAKAENAAVSQQTAAAENTAAPPIANASNASSNSKYEPLSDDE